MKRRFLAFVGALAALVVVTGAALGFAPVETGAHLHLAIEWFEGVTGHADNGLMGTVAALATAPAVMTAELKEKFDQLFKAQKEQTDELQPKIDEAITLGKGAAELKEQFEKANGDVAKRIEEIQKITEERRKELQDRLDEFESKYGPEARRQQPERPGQVYVKDLAKKAGQDDYADKFFDAGRAPKIKIAVKEDPLISGAEGSAEDLQDSLRLQGVYRDPDTQLTVQALLPTIGTDNRTVDWVVETEFDDQTDIVPEGEEKPYSDLSFEPKSETMRTIAHLFKATRQILRYSNRTQLAAYIDGRARFGVRRKLETEIIAGDGTGSRFDGLLKQAAAYARGYADINAEDATHLDTLRRAFTQLRLKEYSATGIVLHPVEVEAIDLIKDGNLNYVWRLPWEGGGLRYRGVPVVENTIMPEDEFLIGAFQLGAELYVGQQLAVEVFPQNDKDVEKNLVTIRAEMDALLAVLLPNAFVAGAFTEPT